MKKHLELTEKSSCLTQAAYDEPLFILRANDELAPHTVRRWAQEYAILKSDEGKRPLDSNQERKYQAALQVALDMEIWKKEHP